MASRSWDNHLKLGQALCDAWGLDAQQVKAISIDIAVDGLKVLVELLPDPKVDIVSEFAKYRLVLDEGGEA